MKRSAILTIFCLLWLNMAAQVPQAFKYQAVVRDNLGNVLSDRSVSFKISLLRGSVSGISVYIETHMGKTTNAYGLVELEIGKGTPVTGTFNSIIWSSGTFYLKVEFDPAGRTAFQEMGTSQLLSVPYALYANDVKNKDDDDADPTNEIQTVGLTGSQLSLSKGGGTVTLPSSTAADNWGTQFVVSDVTLTGQGTTSFPLKIAQQSATNGQVLKWNGSSWLPRNDEIGSGGLILPFAGTAATDDVVLSITNNGSGAGILGQRTSLTGNANGVVGSIKSNEGNGVAGFALSGSGYTCGVYGNSASGSGIGVYGTGTSTAGGIGVYGKAYASSGIGVYGEAEKNGVIGKNLGAGGIGVFGSSETTNSKGVSGWAMQSGSTGVWGEGEKYGVRGIGNNSGVYGSSDNWGVHGESSNCGVMGYAYKYGVYGVSTNETGRGITGEAKAANSYGVHGVAKGTGSTGIWGDGEKWGIYGIGNEKGVYGYSVNGNGIYGYSVNQNGVFGTGSNTGIYGESSNYGVYGEGKIGVKGFTNNSSAGLSGVWGEASTGYGVGTRGISWGEQGTGVVGQGKAYDFKAAGSGVDYGSESSIRWKRNILPIPDPLIKVLELRGVYFNWDEAHGGKHDVGMIAEEVGKILPEIVVYEENGFDASGLDYSKITPLLVEAIKAQQVLIQSLESRLLKLENTLQPPSEKK